MSLNKIDYFSSLTSDWIKEIVSYLTFDEAQALPLVCKKFSNELIFESIKIEPIDFSKCKSLKIFKVLSSRKDLNVEMINYAFQYAVLNDCETVLNELPEEDKINLKNKEYVDIVKKLLTDPRVDPSATTNYYNLGEKINCPPFYFACRCGNLEIVKLLIEHQVDPSTNNSEGFRLACMEGHFEIVQELLKNDKVNPSIENNSLIRSACSIGDLKIVKILLKDKRVDPSAESNEALRIACRNGHGDVVEQLLKDQRVDPSALDNSAIRIACIEGKLNIIKILLNDQRVDPSLYYNEALQNARRLGYKEIVEELLKHPKVIDEEKRRDAIFISYN